jgi:hypothetical protein
VGELGARLVERFAKRPEALRLRIGDRQRQILLADLVTRVELTQAYLDWEERTDRFTEVPSSLERIDAPRPPWLPTTR